MGLLRGVLRRAWFWNLVITVAIFWRQPWSVAVLTTYLPQAGRVELFQVLLSIDGLGYSRLNLREVWIDFRFCFEGRSSPVRDFLWPSRWRQERTKQRLTAHANVMNEVIRVGGQLAYLAFGLWTWTVPPPPPNLIRDIGALAQQFGPQLLGLELMVIFSSAKTLAQSVHDRHARLAIATVPFRRRETDRPLPMVDSNGVAS